VERPSYEEWKRKQKEEQDKLDKLAGNEEQLMSGWPARLPGCMPLVGAQPHCPVVCSQGA
jgi:hypothetical protein